MLSGSNLDFVFSNVGQKWTNIKKIITIDIESTNVNFTNHLTMHWKVVPFINAITDIEKYELQSQCYKLQYMDNISNLVSNYLTMHWRVVPFINAITDIEK